MKKTNIKLTVMGKWRFWNKISFIITFFLLVNVTSVFANQGITNANSNLSYQVVAPDNQNLLVPLKTLQGGLVPEYELKSSKQDYYYKQFPLYFTQNQAVHISFKGNGQDVYMLQFSDEDNHSWQQYDLWDNPTLDVVIPRTGNYFLRIYYADKDELATSIFQVAVNDIILQADYQNDDGIISLEDDAKYQEFPLTFQEGQYIRFTYRGSDEYPIILVIGEDVAWDNYEARDDPKNLDVAITKTGDYVLRIYGSKALLTNSQFQIDIGELQVRNSGVMRLNQTIHCMVYGNPQKPAHYTFTAHKTGYYQFGLYPPRTDPWFEFKSSNFTLHGGGRSRNSSTNRGLVTYLQPGQYDFMVYYSNDLLSITPKFINVPTNIPLNTRIYGQYQGTAVNYTLVVPQQTRVVITHKPEDIIGIADEERYMDSRLTLKGANYSWYGKGIDVEFDNTLAAGTYQIVVESTNFKRRPQDFTLLVGMPDLQPFME